jgi:hypothetical protein
MAIEEGTDDQSPAPTVADLVRKLLDMPQGARFALTGDGCSTTDFDVELFNGVVQILGYDP